MSFFHSLIYSQGGGETPSILAYQYSISNKFVDVLFNGGVFGANDGSTAAAASDFQITNLVGGGATNVQIASVKQPDHHTSASAGALIGGESIIRFFLTITGTPDSTESFQIQPVADSVYDSEGVVFPSSKTTGTIKLMVTPANLWDAELMSSVAVTGEGVSTMTDVMGSINLTQTTDADRPNYTNGVRVNFDRTNTEFLLGGDQASMEFQQGTDFTFVIHGLNTDLLAAAGDILSDKDANTEGWNIGTSAADGSLFFVMHDGTSQNFADVDAFNGTGERTIICVNSGGVLSIYDENNTIIGTQGSTSIAAIDYTGNEFMVGQRDGGTSRYWNGYFKKIAKYSSALTEDQRQDVLDNLDVNLSQNLLSPATSVQSFNTEFASFKVGAFVSYGMTTYTASDGYATNRLLVPPSAATFDPPANILELAEGWVDSLEATGKVDLYCFTTGHHIGFSMWDTQIVLKEQTVTDAQHGEITLPQVTPYKYSALDILGTLVTTAKGYGKPVYLYYNMGRRVNERGSDKYGDHSLYFNFIEAQLKELIDLYNPTGFFIDGQQDEPWVDNSVGGYLHRMYSSIKAYSPNIKFIANEAPINDSMLIGGNINKFPADVGCFERDIGRVLTDTDEYDYTILKNHYGTDYVKNCIDIITLNTGIVYFGSEDKSATDRTQQAVQDYYDASKAVGIPTFINFSISQDGTLQSSQIAFLTNLTL